MAVARLHLRLANIRDWTNVPRLQQRSAASIEPRNEYSRSRNHSQSSRRSSRCVRLLLAEAWEELTNWLVRTTARERSVHAGQATGVAWMRPWRRSVDVGALSF